MKRHQCEVCGLIYDQAAGLPDEGIPPGTPFEALPEEWLCPDCGAGKDAFAPLAE